MAICRRRHCRRVRGKADRNPGLQVCCFNEHMTDVAIGLDLGHVRALTRPRTRPRPRDPDLLRLSRYPLDVVKSRLQLQSGKATGADSYTGMVDCFQKIVRNEG